MNSALAISLSLLEVLAGLKSVKKLLGIIHSADFEARMLFTQVIDLKHCRDIGAHIVKKHKHFWATSVPPRKYSQVFTLSVVVQNRKFR